VKGLIEFQLADGSTVLVEAEETVTSPKTMRGSASTSIAQRAEQTFEGALENIKPVAAAFIAKLNEIVNPPQQIAVEFGIKLSAKAGAFIASADTEANFKVTLTWKHEYKETGPDAKT
jgi:hypothetical protein